MSSGLLVELGEQVLVQRESVTLVALGGVIVLDLQGRAELETGGEESSGLIWCHGRS